MHRNRLAHRLALTITTALALGAFSASAQAATPWWTADGATWTQSYITEPDGTQLHADVLRPSNLPLNARTPVILSIGPYFGHAGETGPDYFPDGPNNAGPEPDNRFKDFLEGTDLFRHGYAWVQVDLRDFGGSSGCTDFGGKGEQQDVKSSVEWAASQPWSTGSVGMYGKSYDAFTGVMGEAVQPKGLKAIVGQEPVYDGYWNVYAYGVAAFGPETQAEDYAYADEPNFTVQDSPGYIVDGTNSGPGCPAPNAAGQHNPNRFSPYWQQHDLIAKAEGHEIPFFLTQGFLENNTKPLGAWDFFDELKGPKKAWFDMTDHIRGNDVAEGDNKAPHPWFDQVMRFYNHYVKGVPLSNPAGATDKDPAVAVETSDGSWRAEQQWPPLDSTAYDVKLKPGAYTDGFNAADNEDDGFNDSLGQGSWTISPPLGHDAHFAGVPQAALDVTAQLPRADLSIDVYDVHPDDNATLVSRTAYLLEMGEQQIYPELYGNDWQFAKGDRVAILVTSANDTWWGPTPTQGQVTVNPGSVVTLPWLAYSRSKTLTGYKTPARLGDWTSGGGQLALDAATISAGQDPAFNLPPAEKKAPGKFNKGDHGLGIGFQSDGTNASPGSIR